MFNLSEPWITKGIGKSIKTKNQLFISGETDAYRNKVLILTLIIKKMYFHKYFEENFRNTKKVWEGTIVF